MVIINKILITLFLMACLTTLRHLYYFIQAYLTSTDEVPVKYRVSSISLLFLCISIAFILSSIITGITL
jgi:hypothetical protein